MHSARCLRGYKVARLQGCPPYPIRIIRNDAIYPQVQQSAHVFYFIDRPRDDLNAFLMAGFKGFARDQALIRAVNVRLEPQIGQVVIQSPDVFHQQCEFYGGMGPVEVLQGAHIKRLQIGLILNAQDF